MIDSTYIAKLSIEKKERPVWHYFLNGNICIVAFLVTKKDLASS
jgi:hypothetical protein